MQTKTKLITQWAEFPMNNLDIIPSFLVHLARRIIRNHQAMCGDALLPNNLIFGANHYLLQARYSLTNLFIWMTTLIMYYVANREFGWFERGNPVGPDSIPALIGSSIFFWVQNSQTWSKAKQFSHDPTAFPLKNPKGNTRGRMFAEFAECCNLADILFHNRNQNGSLIGYSEVGFNLMKSKVEAFDSLDEFMNYFTPRICERCVELAMQIIRSCADTSDQNDLREKLNTLIDLSVKFKLVGPLGLHSVIAQKIYHDSFEEAKLRLSKEKE